MKTSKLKLLTLAAVMVVGLRTAQAADMYFGFDTPYQLLLPGSANGSGRVWLGNFGSTSFNSVNDSVGGGTGMNTSLLNTFNPLASFGIDSDGFFNGNGVTGATGSYNASPTYLYSGQVALNAFAGQDAYLLVLNSSSNVWDTAKAEWAAFGSLTSILVKSGSSFDSEAGESSAGDLPGPKYYSVSPGSGTLMLGDYNVAAGTITASVIPEPSVGALLLLGGGALALIRARRTRE
jgi:hypothetical protein